MRIVGIDPSLTNTGVYFGPGEWCEIKGGKARGAERLLNFYNTISGLLAENPPERAVVEGYAFASTHSRAHRLGELGGVLRLALIEWGVKEIYEVPPKSLKKFFTDNGNADKAAMLKEAERRGGETLPGDDVADACALWYAGHDDTFLHAKATIDQLTP